MDTRVTQRLKPAVPLTRAEGQALMTVQYDALIALLRSLTDEEWNAVSDCPPWTVKDVVSHLIGWAEAFTSFSEIGHQSVGAIKRRGEFNGDLLDAQNQVQVDDRAHLAPSEVLAQFEAVIPRFVRQRSRLGFVGKVVPFYFPIFGLTNLAYLMITIFNRDAFMHRIDISHPLGKEIVLGGPEARLLEDIAADWSERTGAAARLHLTGPAGGDYVVGVGPRAELTADAIVFARVLAGRGKPDEIEIEGDADAARGWLKRGCPF